MTGLLKVPNCGQGFVKPESKRIWFVSFLFSGLRLFINTVFGGFTDKEAHNFQINMAVGPGGQH